MLSGNPVARDGFVPFDSSWNGFPSTNLAAAVTYLGRAIVVFTSAGGTNYAVGSVACGPGVPASTSPTPSTSPAPSPSFVFAVGVVYTIAGNAGGAAGYDGDGGPATLAHLNTPQGIAFDAAGNYAFAEFYNNVVRFVTKATGVVTTLVTGLSHPSGVAFDPTTGNLAVCDNSNNRVLVVNASTGATKTVAAFAGFSPYGVAFNTFGDLAVSDVTNNRVLLLRKGAANATTVVGGQSPVCRNVSVNNPIGVSFAGAGSSLAIADYDNRRIVFCDVGTGAWSTFNGTAGGSGQLNGPWGLAFDQTGNLAIADQLNHRVELLSPGTAAGTLATIAGSNAGTPGWVGDGGAAASSFLVNPAGLAYDASNGLAIADQVSCGRALI